MINEVNILHKGHGGYFADNAGKKSAGLLCVISYHHKSIVELGKYGFDALSKPLVSPSRRSPVLLIQPIRNFQSDICDIKEVLLHLCAEITFVSEYHTIVVFPLHILEIVKVMNTCSSHVVRMDYSLYPTDCMEFIAIIMHPLRSTVTPVRYCLGIVLPHNAAFGSRILTDLNWFGVYAEYIFLSVHSHCYILAYLLGKTCRLLTFITI